LEGVVEQVERSGKQTAREMNDALRTTEGNVNSSQKELERDIRALRKEVDTKIQKAMDNPLAK
jgi:hypothetical protein